MRRFVSLIGAFSVLWFAEVATAQDTPGRVTVDGRGAVAAEPDLASISMAAQSRNIEMATARSRVVQVTREFLDLCERLQIDDSNIRTTGLTVHPEYRWNERTRQQELQGYLVRRQLEVELDDLEKLGELMEGAVNVGVNEVSPPRLKSSRERELHRDALAAAAADARANARALADTLGAALGDVIEVSASRVVVPRPMVRAEMMGMAQVAADAETYSAGEIRFEANVTASFELLAN